MYICRVTPPHTPSPHRPPQQPPLGPFSQMNPCQNAARCSDFAFFFPPSLPLLSLSPSSSLSLSLSSSLHLPAERQLRQTGVLDKPVLQGEGGSFRSGFGPAAEQKSQNNHPVPLASALQNPAVFFCCCCCFLSNYSDRGAAEEHTRETCKCVCLCALHQWYHSVPPTVRPHRAAQPLQGHGRTALH